MSKKIISFSLWGNDTRYTIGALQNVSLAKTVYPDWLCRFYIGKSTPQYIITQLSEFNNVEIIQMDEEGDWTGMFWRFLVASDKNVEVSIVRDCDSRLWFREKAAVDEWLKSKKDFHIMRDHEYHDTAILGGMWGVRGNLLSDMKDFCIKYEKGDFWQVDQNFLRDIIYPRVKDHAFVHDTFFEKYSFPGKRDPKHFVGQVYAGCGRILDADEYFQEFMRREYDAQGS